MSHLRRSLSAALALAAFSPLSAQQTWSNAGTAWSTAANWSTSNVPNTNSEKPIFGTSASPVNPNVDANYTVLGLMFSNNMTTSYTFGAPAR